jgi:hypothetical protein
MSMSEQEALVKYVTRGFMDALYLCSDYTGSDREFSAEACELATEFVRVHLDRFSVFDWQANGDAHKLGRYLYLTASDQGRGFWTGDWGRRLGSKLDILTMRIDWRVYLDTDGKLGLE